MCRCIMSRERNVSAIYCTEYTVNKGQSSGLGVGWRANNQSLYNLTCYIDL